MTYKFVIDGIGIQFDDIYRNKLETGIAYQKKAMLEFWKSTKEIGYVLVYKRYEDNSFERFPFEVHEINRNGESKKIEVEEWSNLRMPKRR